MSATVCTVSRQQFMGSGAKSVSLLQTPFLLVPREYAAPKGAERGSFGYNVNGKVTLVVDGQDVVFQFSGNLVAVNSKQLA